MTVQVIDQTLKRIDRRNPVLNAFTAVTAERIRVIVQQIYNFAIRKLHLAMRANALVVFPGGFGTLDELFEALTLVQTGKVTSFPVVLMGTAYWGPLVAWLRDTVLVEGKISAKDLELLNVTDDPDEAVRIIAASQSGDAPVSPPSDWYPPVEA